MSIRTATTVKAAIEHLGPGCPVEALTLPAGRLPPYLLIHELPSTAVFDGHGDFGDPAADESLAELCQVDYVFRARDAAGRAGDDPTLLDRLAAGLRGARLVSAPWHCYGVSLDGFGPRQDFPDGTAQTSLTIRIRRALRRL